MTWTKNEALQRLRSDLLAKSVCLVEASGELGRLEESRQYWQRSSDQFRAQRDALAARVDELEERLATSFRAAVERVDSDRLKRAIDYVAANTKAMLHDEEDEPIMLDLMHGAVKLAARVKALEGLLREVDHCFHAALPGGWEKARVPSSPCWFDRRAAALADAQEGGDA